MPPKTLKPRGGKKVRPKKLTLKYTNWSVVHGQYVWVGNVDDIHVENLEMKDCLKLANWLISAAEYLKAKGDGK